MESIPDVSYAIHPSLREALDASYIFVCGALPANDYSVPVAYGHKESVITVARWDVPCANG